MFDCRSSHNRYSWYRYVNFWSFNRRTQNKVKRENRLNSLRTDCNEPNPMDTQNCGSIFFQINRFLLRIIENYLMHLFRQSTFIHVNLKYNKGIDFLQYLWVFLQIYFARGFPRQIEHDKHKQYKHLRDEQKVNLYLVSTLFSDRGLWISSKRMPVTSRIAKFDSNHNSFII